METTHKVQVWTTEVVHGKRSTSYKVRWATAGKTHKQTFKTSALADSFRSKLVTASKSGDSFDVKSGLPVAMLRPKEEEKPTLTFYQVACNFVDVRWREASPGDRKTTADSLIPITVAMLNTTKGRGAPTPDVLRRALRVAFNPNRRDHEHGPEISAALRWFEAHSRDVEELAQPSVFRMVLAAIDIKLDGKRAAANTIRLRRLALRGVILHAIKEEKALSANPLEEVKTKRKPVSTIREVDRRSVVNRMQGRMLLSAVAVIAPYLEAFFALMYYAGLRPEEAANLGKNNLALPPSGWGDINLEEAAPEVGPQWTDSAERNEVRGLKHRAEGVGRTVPSCPELTAILWRHIERFGVAPDGKLFRGRRNNGRIGSSTYGRVWAQAREAVFTPEVVASLLGKRPYDLRHACLSFWLIAGVEPTRVAAWAGNSVAVLLREYAKFLDGGESDARAKVERLLGPPEPGQK